MDTTSFTERTPLLQTKLPAVGTTIFSVMSALAAEKNAVNLGQGFPDFECDPLLIDAVTDAMRRGLNQYPPMPGVPVLRDAISSKLLKLHGHHYDSNSEITVTAGATQAIITVILAVVHPGDEVIVLEPCYACAPIFSNTPSGHHSSRSMRSASGYNSLRENLSASSKMVC